MFVAGVVLASQSLFAGTALKHDDFAGVTLYYKVITPRDYVYVARILDDAIPKTLVITLGQVELIAWGTIFRTLDEAAAHAQLFQQCLS